MIHATKGKLHWNYFIALERDPELASRYVEFCPQNFEVYSIEFAHLLFAAASEVDVNELAAAGKPRLFALDTTRALQPEPSLLRFDGDYDYKYANPTAHV